jgi:transcriptional regulator with AAA-type ATPase domain
VKLRQQIRTAANDDLFPQIEKLLTTGTHTPMVRSAQNLPPDRVSNARLILISESTQPTLSKAIDYQIEVPGLRVRKANLEAQVSYYISIICRQKQIPKLQVTPEAIRRLQAYDFSDNLQELQGMVDRALVQTQGSTLLTEEVFWAQGAKKQLFRWNLLNAYPWLRQFLNSDWYPDRVNYGFTVWVFPIVVAILFIAPRSFQKKCKKSLKNIQMNGAISGSSIDIELD